MRTLQNQNAVSYFLEEIFPLIKKENKDAEFHIVGAEPPKYILDKANSDNVYVTGFVDSVEEYIKDSCVLVAPVRIAAGIQNKVLIGMACKIPVILTSLISKAIPELIDDKNCYIKDSAEEFAEKCILLMNNKEKRKEIAEAGYDIMKDYYSWNSLLEGYEIL